MATGRGISLSLRVEQLARKTATPVRLEALYRWGVGDADTRLRTAKFLHREIAIRNAQLCKELSVLPYGLAQTAGIVEVAQNFGKYVDWLVDSPTPQSTEDGAQFTELLQRILEDNSDVVNTIGSGVLELRDKLRDTSGEDGYEAIRSEVDLFLDRFFIKRIGLRFLLDHHVQSAVARPGVSGIIHSDVAVGPIVRSAAEEARQLCMQHFGVAPEVTCTGDGDGEPFNRSFDPPRDRQFTYVPSHLRYSCAILLQQACYAVAQQHVDLGSPLPPVSATYAHGTDEVTVRVSDSGGGIPRSAERYVWSYFVVPGDEDEPGLGSRTAIPLGGNLRKAGLPLARLHARYYGGDLVLKYTEGCGLDAFLYMNRLGKNCENLPHGVRVSPSMRDSSVGEETSIFFLDSLTNITEQEGAILIRKLREQRKTLSLKQASADVRAMSSFRPLEDLMTECRRHPEVNSAHGRGSEAQSRKT